MKKIVMILTNGFDPDPRVYKEAYYLVNRGFKVTVLCWDRDINRNNPVKESIDGINVVRYKIPSEYGSGKIQIFAYTKFIIRCKKYLCANDVNYVHCNDLDGMIAGYISSNHKSKLVFDMHELYEDVGEGHKLKRKILRFVTKLMIKRCVAALYENDIYLNDNYRDIRSKLKPLKNYPDSKLIVPMNKLSAEKFRIGYFGGLRTQIPQFTTLFDAVKDMDDVEVMIRGTGPDLKMLQELSRKYTNVTVGGPFDGIKELTDLYANIDIVYAGYRPDSDTREYAEVVKFFECILTGTPIILTDVYTSMAKRIVSSGYGIICDTLNVEQVKSAIIKLKTERQFWDECSKNEKRDAHLYDWNEAVKILDEVYK